MRTPLLQDGELVAQDQDLRGFPCLLTLGQPKPRGDPRYQEEDQPQADDRRSSRPDARRATQLVRAVDEILGTHRAAGEQLCWSEPMDEIPGTHSPVGSHLPADDIMLFVRTRNAASLRALVLDRLQTMDGVMSTHTVLVFDEL
jgi:hypothetical protein